MPRRKSKKASSSRNVVNIEGDDRTKLRRPGSSSVPVESDHLLSATPISDPIDFGHLLSPTPISSIVPPPTSTAPATHEQPESSDADAKKKRDRCEITEKGTMSLELFQHEGGGQNYILSMNEVYAETIEKKKAYHLSLVQEKGKWNVAVKKTSLPNNLIPVTEITGTPFLLKAPLSLPERLKGWTVQKRARNTTNTGAKDKYYYREGERQCYRSHSEVATFVLYSCRKEDLGNAKAKDMPPKKEKDMLRKKEKVQLAPRPQEQPQFNSQKTHRREVEQEAPAKTANGSTSSEVGNKAKEAPKERGKGKWPEPTAEELEIFKYCLDNPIVDLDELGIFPDW